MSAPLVNIIVTTMNRPHLLAMTLDSIISQDYPAKKIVVVDDGSASGELEKTHEACAARGISCIGQENRGLPSARNLGVAHCEAGLLMFMDDDDICPPGSLRARVESLEPSYGHVVGRLRRFHEPTPGEMVFIESEKESSHYFCMGAALMTREAYEAVNGFDPAFLRAEDMDFWLRTREAGVEIKFIPEICLYYRRHKESLSHNLYESDRVLLNTLHTALRRRREKAKTRE